jgi:hypothetical protein
LTETSVLKQNFCTLFSELAPHCCHSPEEFPALTSRAC